MPDITLAASVTRTQLGLGDLNINDHVSFYLATQLLGAQVQWNRQQVTSPFTDGAVTTQRFRQQVTEQVGVEVLAATAAEMQTNLAELLAAFCQDSYTLTLVVDGTTYAYRCEAADYQVAWTGPRFAARQGQVLFNVPRQPEPVSGGV